MIIESFNYISNPDCIAVILGTMPGEESLRQKKYYAHSDNLFWDIIIRVLKPDLTDKAIEILSYEDKTNALLDNKIALWDVLKFCNRKGNLDSAIRNEIKNNFENFFEVNNKIRTVFFNGQLSQKHFDKTYGDLAKRLDLRQIVLPSTSSSHKLNCFQKLKEWRVVCDLTTQKV